MQPSRNRSRYSKPVPLAKKRTGKSKNTKFLPKKTQTVRSGINSKKLKGKSSRIQRQEVRRFTKENQVKKIFGRSILALHVTLVLLVLSTMFTPLLAINKITVAGEQKVSEKQIQATLKKYIGTPLPMVNGDAVAKDLAKFKLIESISLVSSPPHELQVRIIERTAISLVVKDGIAYLYDPSGIRIGKATGSEKLPTIIITGDPKTSKNYSQAIDVLLSLPATLLEKVSFIQARTRDNVTMRLRGNVKQTIIWGDSTEGALKSRVLKVLLFRTPARIPATFDVSSPLTPSVIR